MNYQYIIYMASGYLIGSKSKLVIKYGVWVDSSPAKVPSDKKRIKGSID